MSRPSIRPLRPRESVFAGGPELYRGDAHTVCSPNIRACVEAMEDCCEQAAEGQHALREGTRDLERMTRVLSNNRVFILVAESTVNRYRADVADEIEPQINELIVRAEKGLKALSRKEIQLQSKVDTAKAKPTIKPPGVSGASNRIETRRLQMLTQQKERLEAELAELEAEVKQLERQTML